MPLPLDEVDELDEDEHDAALETADDEVLWIRGGGVGLFFLPLMHRDESVEWSRDVAEDLPLVINCWENVTFEGGFIDECERVFGSLIADTDSGAGGGGGVAELVGEISAWRTI